MNSWLNCCPNSWGANTRYLKNLQTPMPDYWNEPKKKAEGQDYICKHQLKGFN